MNRNLCIPVVVLLCMFVIITSTPSGAGAGEQASQATTVTIYPTDDSFVYSRMPDTNYGSRADLQIGGLEQVIPTPKSRAYLKFDLSGLPSGATIVSARVCVKTLPSATGPSPILHQVSAYYQSSDAWNEGTITWNNAPGFSAQARGTQYILVGNNWYYFGVSPDIEDAFTTDMTYSVVLKPTIENNQWFRFYSNNAASSTDRPYLEVVYNNCPPPPDPPTPPPFALYIHDVGTFPHWGQNYSPPYWETMDPDSTAFARPSNGQDLDLDFPFYAVSAQLTGDYSADYIADLWFANNYAGRSNLVVAELRRGTCDNDGTLIASDHVYVTNARPAQRYRFDFGHLEGLDLSDESLILKLIYYGPSEWDCHVYWDHSAKPSALIATPAPVDTVVCEPAGGANPMHASTYWYDVIPGSFGRCDFHVRVYDLEPDHYANPSLPAPTWQFAVHPVGDEWWASWWDSGCTNAIFTTFRFQFEHNDEIQWRVWGEWRTTIGGTSDPYYMAVDSSDAHTGETDGYGYRVHVPSEPSTAVGDKVVAQRLELAQNIPNPFNPWTRIAYTIPAVQSDVRVTLNIYDVAGRVVKTLVDTVQPAGTYTAEWDGTDDGGSGVASGVYFCRLRWNGDSRMIRLVLLR